MGDYKEKIQKKLDALGISPGSLIDATVFHDDWCDLYQGKGPECNCDPDVKVDAVIDKNRTN